MEGMDYIHTRILSIHFRLVEKYLRDIIMNNTLMNNTSDSHFILYSINNDIDSELTNRLLRISNIMLEEIENIQKEFELESEDLSVKRRILSNLNEIWGLSKDLTMGRLHGYENLSKYDKQYLDLHTLRLYSMIENLYDLLR
jgi:hypothetical protein